MVNLAILANLVFLVNLASLTKLVNLAQWSCALINFPVSFFLLVTSPLLLPTYNFLLSPYSLLSSPFSFLLITFSLLPFYFLFTTFLLPPYYLPPSSLLPSTFSLPLSPFYLEKTTTPSPFIPSISMRKGWLKRTCRTYCVSSMAGMASRISLRKRPSGMFVSIVK